MKPAAALLIITSLLGGCSSLVMDGTVLRAHDNFQEGDYTETIQITDYALRAYAYNDDVKAELLFLKAMSYEKLQDYSSALTLYQYTAYKYPDTEHGFRAKAIVDAIEQQKPSI